MPLDVAGSPDSPLPLQSAARESLLRSRQSVDEGLVSEEEFLAALARREGVEILEHAPVGLIEPVTREIPPAYMEEFLLVPLARTPEGRVRLAVARELDDATRHELEAVLECRIDLVVAPKSTVLELIESVYEDGDGAGRPEDRLETGDSRDLEELANQPPVIRLVNFLIQEGFRKGASDVHLEAMEEGLKVRYRIDGALQDVTRPPERYRSAIVSRVKILADLDVTERRRPQDGRLRMRIDDRPVDLRVATVPTLHGESVVLRLLDQESIRIPLNELGFAPGILTRFARLVESPHGIVLVTGPTGSGKTTTLYAALSRRNRPEVKIVTVEDPVEYQLPGVNQVQVRPDIGLTFADGLRSLLRQDPDILMVGEMRDFETAEIAIQAALTGHLVFSTLHTNDAPGGVTRLLEMGIEDYLVCSTVSAILAQRLVRTVCSACARPLSADELAPESRIVLEGLGNLDRLRLGNGCERCGETGYRGRTGIFELLVVDDGVREAILDQATSERIRGIAEAAGMRSMREDGLRKAAAGATTVEEVLRVTREEADFR